MGLVNIGAKCEMFLRGLFSGYSSNQIQSDFKPIDESKSLDKYMSTFILVVYIKIRITEVIGIKK